MNEPTAEQATGPKIFTPEYYERMRRLEARGWWNAGMREAAERLLRHARLGSSGRMLDAGCGSGQTMTWFRTLHPGWRTFGFDIAAEGVRAARHFGEEGTVLGSALEIPFADAAFDALVTLDVVQHLPLPDGDRTALGEMARVLRPGGVLLLRTNAQAFPATEDDHEFNFHKYETRELSEKLAAAGFEVLRLSRINALLGLAEIPRELRADREVGSGYHGLLAQEDQPRDALSGLKRAWLSFEGGLVARGLRLPLGRTHLALARRRS